MGYPDLSLMAFEHTTLLRRRPLDVSSTVLRFEVPQEGKEIREAAKATDS